jgi:hypothetical protein
VEGEDDKRGKVVRRVDCSIELGSGQARPHNFRLRGSEYVNTVFNERKAHGARVVIWAAINGTTKSEAFYLPGDSNPPCGCATAMLNLACLKEHLPPLMEGDGKIFIMDGSSVPTAGILRNWHREKGYTVME